MAMITDLQKLTDVWGKWFAQQNKTTLTWTASTNYDAHHELKGWEKYQVEALVGDPQFAITQAIPGPSVAATTMNFTNNTSVQQSETYTASATTTQSFTWSLTQTASVTATASFWRGLRALLR